MPSTDAPERETTNYLAQTDERRPAFSGSPLREMSLPHVAVESSAPPLTSSMNSVHLQSLSLHSLASPQHPTLDPLHLPALNIPPDLSLNPLHLQPRCRFLGSPYQSSPSLSSNSSFKTNNLKNFASQSDSKHTMQNDQLHTSTAEMIEKVSFTDTGQDSMWSSWDRYNNMIALDSGFHSKKD